MNENATNIPQSLLDKSLPPFVWDLPRPLTPIDALGLAGKGLPFYSSSLNIADVMDMTEFRRALVDGYVDVQSSNGLYVFKYADRTMFEGAWDSVTLRCRGLVTDVNGRIVARGWNKFFNLSEIEHLMDSETLHYHLTNGALVMPKFDGSLGIVWRGENGQWQVATPGSLKSTQARHAQRLMNERYDSFDVLPGQTLLVEIVNPDNRIVTDYGDLDDLILLGGADSHGQWVHPDDIGELWPGLRVDVQCGNALSIMAEQEASGELTNDFEGWVVYLPALGTLVKVKRDSYLKLHKIKFSLTRREVYRQLRDGGFDSFITSLPDEFVDLALSWADAMTDEVQSIISAADRVWSDLGGPDADLSNAEERKAVIQKLRGQGFHRDFMNILIGVHISRHDMFVSILRNLDIYQPGSYARKILVGVE